MKIVSSSYILYHFASVVLAIDQIDQFVHYLFVLFTFCAIAMYLYR